MNRRLGFTVYHLVDPQQPHEHYHDDENDLPDVIVEIVAVLGLDLVYPRHDEQPRYIGGEDERDACEESQALQLLWGRIDQDEGGVDQHDVDRSALRRDDPCAVREVQRVAVHPYRQTGELDQILQDQAGVDVKEGEILFPAEVPDNTIGKDHQGKEGKHHPKETAVLRAVLRRFLLIRLVLY